MAVTPRQYLDFISHFTKLYTQKREELEQQQLHLNTGLGKIRETESQVEDMKTIPLIVNLHRWLNCVSR